jgi:hypothetical protein
MNPGPTSVSAGHAGHRHCGGDDHIRQFRQQVIAAAADA